MTTTTPAFTLTIINTETGVTTTEPCYEMPTGMTAEEIGTWMQEMTLELGQDA